ncbi:putative glutathione-specific gamma-glutamylcyclotransferase 2 [Anabrus simplex]|uniref:putative glutathione-specific gamma-glutamylcyclotransferase 2 n=1 Tax=Anabrus simplex TaxID=316456 RepID=UPI0035A2645E
MQEQHVQEAADRPAGTSTSGLWVFGYGSLCWHPGFEYDKSLTGFVRGWARRFWQGNITHRGTEGKPGRVATLVEDKEGVVWGRAFQIKGEAALPYLDARECKLGGYLTQLTTFYPRGQREPFLAVLYVATPTNKHWLGDAPLTDMARQIVDSFGPSGHNVEYVLRLANFMREHIPDAEDEHLFSLEILIRTFIKEKRLCLATLMGPDVAPLRSDSDSESSSDEAEGAVGGEPAPRPGSFQYTSRMPPKKLRCLNI